MHAQVSLLDSQRVVVRGLPTDGAVRDEGQHEPDAQFPGVGFGGEAYAVMMCESDGDPSAVSPDGQNVGLYQINLIHGWTREQLLDPVINTLAMLALYADQSWAPWSCKP